MNRTHIQRILALIWLAGLSLFILAGAPLAPFHGDETHQLFYSRDYATAFIDRNPAALMVESATDSQAASGRIIDSSLPRYAFGLAWHLAGYDPEPLPDGYWAWQLDYEANLAIGNRPPQGILNAARAASALFMVGGTGVMFALGRRFGGWVPAYVASGLYALNPVLLLNGRRAMQESSWIFFGLLILLLAALMSQRLARAGRIGWQWWVGFILIGGFALAGKFTAIVYLTAACGWLFMTAFLARQPRGLLRMTALLLASGLLMLVVFIGLAPGYWNNPLYHFQEAAALRPATIHAQLGATGRAPLTPGERIRHIVTETYMQPVMHFEVATWGDYEPITREITRYMNSPLSGFQAGGILGGALTLLAGSGLVGSAWRAARARSIEERAQFSAVVVWVGLTMLAVYPNPLPWQRYYLPLMPVVSLITAIAVAQIYEKLLKS